MNATNKTADIDILKRTVKARLAALWAALMLLYLYADHFSLFRPGQLGDMMAGKMGPFTVTQGSLLAMSALMAIPAVMVFLSIALKPQVSRWANARVGKILG